MALPGIAVLFDNIAFIITFAIIMARALIGQNAFSVLFHVSFGAHAA